MTFDPAKHPRGFGGKFKPLSAGEHAFKSAKHSQAAGQATAKARNILSGPHFRTPSGKKAIAHQIKTAEGHQALARLHAHAAKRVNGGGSSRLGSGARVGRPAKLKSPDDGNNFIRQHNAEKLTFAQAAKNAKSERTIRRIAASQSAANATRASRSHVAGKKVKR